MRDAVTRTIAQVHERYARVDEGVLADYIPELTRADPAHFGIVVVTADGQQYSVGDVSVPFTIQSVSKAFTYGMALDVHGAGAVEKKVDVEPSGEAFNSISLDPETGRPRNPMINAGAIAVTGLLPEDDRFERILTTFSHYAGRELRWDRDVYRSESATGHRNRAIANMLRAVEVLEGDVSEVVEDYFRQCSILVTCTDLASMAATLAAGGQHPTTRMRVLGPANVEKVLAVMGTCGMYDYSGTWMYEVGLPAKSGVGGGVVGVLPGQLGFAAYSPLLDPKGNSVRGVAALRDLSNVLDLHMLRASSSTMHAIRRSYRIADIALSRRRPAHDHDVLASLGTRVLVVELQGDLFAAHLERLVREVHRNWSDTERVVVDLTRTGAVDGSTGLLLRQLASDLAAAAKALLLADPNGLLEDVSLDRSRVVVTESLDDALLLCEEWLLHAVDSAGGDAASFDLDEFELTRWLGEHALARIRDRFEEVGFEPGDTIIQQGDPTDALYLLASGRVRVDLTSEDGAVQRVADMYPGVAFGELGLLEQTERSASVRALTQTRCFVLTRDSLMDLRRVDHLVYTRILEHLLVGMADRLRQASREAASLRD